MAYTTIDKPTDYFNTKLYSGNGTAIGSGGNAITGVGFQSDWTWIKARNDGSEAHYLFDAVRGVTKSLRSNSSVSEGTDAETLSTFDSDGFTLGNNGGVNNGSLNYVSWNWLASNTTASNTDGSITSTVSANTTAGFSIVSYTGTGSNATIGHGLGSAPQVVLLKERNGTNNWLMSHQPLSASLGDYTRFMTLNSTAAVSGAGNIVFQSSAFTSSVFNVGTSVASNGSSQTFIAYCFAEKKGYSKFGSYTGNGNADGTFVYTGFKPAWVIIKNADASESWLLMDNKRPTAGNPNDKGLFANSTSAEETGVNRLDFLSNGFKQRINAGTNNQSGINYIYMAFAENPFVSSGGIPCTAR